MSGLQVGVSLGVDNRWMKVPADLIISEVIEKGKKSVFAEYKEALKVFVYCLTRGNNEKI